MMNWTADLAPGEHAYTVYVRLNETIKADPLLTMYVPGPLNGFTTALVDALTVEQGKGNDTLRVVPEEMNYTQAAEAIARVIEMSQFSAPHRRDVIHFTATLRDCLFPVTVAEIEYAAAATGC